MEANTDSGVKPVIIFQPDVMPISLKEYARRTNQSLPAVRAQAHEGLIPTLQMKKGSTIYVNQYQMLMASMEAAGWDVRAPSSQYSL